MSIEQQTEKKPKKGTPAWTEMDELGFKIGDMNGEWERSDRRRRTVIRPRPRVREIVRTISKP